MNVDNFDYDKLYGIVKSCFVFLKKFTAYEVCNFEITSLYRSIYH